MGTRVDRVFPQRRARTLFLRVPNQDWSKVTRGHVAEFRAAIGNVPQLWKVPTPAVVVAYRKHGERYEHCLLVLEGFRTESLGAITVEGLRKAGYEDEDVSFARARFRRDWMNREHRRFEPGRKVAVFTVRPYRPEEREEMALALFDYLYGPFLRGEVGAAA